MELRTAESKSLIRRKTVKVNAGAGSRSRRSPALHAQLFPPLFSTFLNVLVPLFLLFKMKDMPILWPLQVRNRSRFILFRRFRPDSVSLDAWTLHTGLFLHFSVHV